MCIQSENNKLNPCKALNNYNATNDQGDMSTSDQASLKRVPALGIILTLLAELGGSLRGPIIDILIGINSLEILLISALVRMVVFTMMAVVKGQSIRPSPCNIVYVIIGSVSGVVSNVTQFIAFRLMPLSDAQVVRNTAPVLVLILGCIVLNEKLTKTHYISGAMTLFGVVVLLKPKYIFGTQDTDTDVYEHRLLGTELVVLSSLTLSLTFISLRKLKDTPIIISIFWYTLLQLVATTAILTYLGQLVLPRDWSTWCLSIFVGIADLNSQILHVMALKYESAGIVSIVSTGSCIVLTFIWQIALLGQTIEWSSIVGAVIITSSVLMITFDKCLKEK